MGDSASLLLDPASKLPTTVFHCLYTSQALLNPNPNKVLKELDVVCIMHNKSYISPEQEFLVIEMQDQRENTRLFILKRTVSNQQDEAPIKPAKRTNMKR
jgi:hypothetical protein